MCLSIFFCLPLTERKQKKSFDIKERFLVFGISLFLLLYNVEEKSYSLNSPIIIIDFSLQSKLQAIQNREEKRDESPTIFIWVLALFGIT